ncbi:MAG: hypothetical protein EXS25_01135 [Pedosphaera sp.]|nr:hypothetical protein [Pedosphaera sp.]
MGDPSPEEQAYLERVNRARMWPTEEGVILANSSDPDLLKVYQFFEVDLQRAVNEIGEYPAVAPLVFEPRLITAARRHTEYMLENAVQEHDEHSPETGLVLNTSASRLTAVGYPWTTLGESIFSYATSPDHGHAGFEIDWGLGDGGVQRPPGHRNSNHTSAFREIGIGVTNASNTRVQDGISRIVGPQLVSMSFADRTLPMARITGVVYYDLNTNGVYDAGEGVSGVHIEAPEGQSSAMTRRSGGYAIRAAVAPNTVRFRSGARDLATNTIVGISESTVKLDLKLPSVVSRVQGPSNASIRSGTLYFSNQMPGAERYHWSSVRLEGTRGIEGAKIGADAFDVEVSSGWNPIRKGSAAVGLNSFHLVHGTPSDQVLTYRTQIRPSTAGFLRFRSRLGFSTSTQVASVEVSEGVSDEWQPVFTQRGWGVGGTSQTSYVSAEVSLARYAGRDIQIRFRYRVESGSFFNQETASFGWHFDEIQFSSTLFLMNDLAGDTGADGVFIFQPTRLGPYELRAQPIFNGRALELSPPLAVTAVESSPLGSVVVIGALQQLSEGRHRVGFDLRSGVGGVWKLESAASPSGPWAEVFGATLALESANRWTFTFPSPANSVFYRIRVN